MKLNTSFHLWEILPLPPSINALAYPLGSWLLVQRPHNRITLIFLPNFWRGNDFNGRQPSRCIQLVDQARRAITNMFEIPKIVKCPAGSHRRRDM